MSHTGVSLNFMSLYNVMFKSRLGIFVLIHFTPLYGFKKSNSVNIAKDKFLVLIKTHLWNLIFTHQIYRNVSWYGIYMEAMVYLDGRRHYQLVRGHRKFYGQGEKPSDTPT
ncbi:unnamed protein product, partial [Meganyctiphanes norvegica]